MPNYAYRQMSPQEREQLVQARWERGYPLHSPPHSFRQASNYFVTGINYEHAHVMYSAERRTDFEARVMQAMQEIQADVLGWVILPNHYHLLLGATSLDSVSSVFQSLHGVSSRDWNVADNLVGKRRVWYKFRDSVIRNEKHFYSALNYIHINPVKHGYVLEPYEWLWSSIHNYADARGRDGLSEQERRFPTGELGKGWDE